MTTGAPRVENDASRPVQRRLDAAASNRPIDHELKLQRDDDAQQGRFRRSVWREQLVADEGLYATGRTARYVGRLSNGAVVYEIDGTSEVVIDHGRGFDGSARIVWTTQFGPSSTK